MKTIEELGISPAPWTACAPTKREVSVVCLKNDKWHSVQVVALCRSDRRNADAQLIAAAPKLYEAAERLMFAYNRCEVKIEHVTALCSALAEASGEAANG